MILSESDLSIHTKEATNQLIGFFHEKRESKLKVLDIIFSRFIEGIHQIHNDEMYHHLHEEFNLNYSKHINVKFQKNVHNILDIHHELQIKSIQSLKQAMDVFCAQVLHEAKTEVCQRLNTLSSKQFHVINDALKKLDRTNNEKLAKCRTSNYMEIQTAVNVEKILNSDVRQKDFLRKEEECQMLRHNIQKLTLEFEAGILIKDVLYQETEDLKQHCDNLQDSIQQQQEEQNMNQQVIYEHKNTISILKATVSDYIKIKKETDAKIMTFEKQMKRTEHRMTRNFFQGNSNLKRIHNIKHRVDVALKTVERMSDDQNEIEEEDGVSFGRRKKWRNNRTATRTNEDEDEAIFNEDESTVGDLECQQELNGIGTVSQGESENLKNQIEILESIVNAKEESLEKATSIMDLMKKQQQAYEALFHSKNIGRILASDSVTRSIPICDFEDVIFGHSAVEKNHNLITRAMTSHI